MNTETHEDTEWKIREIQMQQSKSSINLFIKDVIESLKEHQRDIHTLYINEAISTDLQTLNEVFLTIDRAIANLEEIKK